MERVSLTGVIGTGMIGAAMAALFTGNGYKTVVYAVDEIQKQRGIEGYENCFRDLLDSGLVTEKQILQCKKQVTFTCDYEDLRDVEFVFECVQERIGIKHQVYRNLEQHCGRLKAVASSTSAISADELAEGMEKKEKLVVAHPWNPPHLAPCVEVVKSRYTSQEALETVLNILKDIGREAVVLEKGIPGFIGNRLQYAMYREAVYLVEQGVASPEDIDRTLKYSFAPRYTSIGLFEHFDNCGLDLAKDIEDYLFPCLCNDRQASRLVSGHCQAGEYGIKSGQGMLDWRGKDPEELRRRAAAPFKQFFNWQLPEAEGELHTSRRDI